MNKFKKVNEIYVIVDYCFMKNIFILFFKKNEIAF